MSGRRARILFLNSRSEYGGSDMGLYSIVRYLDSRRFERIVLLPHAGPLAPKLQEAGAEVIYLDICRLERLAGAGQLWAFARSFVHSLGRLRDIIRQRGIDLIYTNSSAIQVGALAARLAGIPHVWHLREIWTSPRWLTRPLYRYVYAFSERVIAISQAVAQGNFGQPGPKVVVIYDGVEAARFEGLEADAMRLREKMGLEPGRPMVLTVARLVPQKGLHIFIEAARLAELAGAGAVYCIAGDIPRPMYQSYKERLQRMIREYGLERKVLLLGWREDTPALLRASDIFVLASVGPEGAGLVIPEAWLAGAPAIVPDHSGPSEIVEDGVSGLRFPNADATALSEKILILLRDPALRARLAAAGRQKALARHDAQRNAAQIASLLEPLLRRRNSAEEPA